MTEDKTQEVKASPANKMGMLKDKWKKGITDRLKIVEEGSEDLSIFKIPNKLRRVRDDAYSPRVVSIGPFHRENQDLAAMREHKWRYMLHFLQQIEDPQEYKKCWEKCTDAIYVLDGKVRASYSEKIKYNMDELAEIMLLDGCFILELFHRYDQYLNMKLKDQCDAIYNNAWMIPAVRHDLALLENQIPFFILKLLYDTIMPNVVKGKSPNSIASLALKFFQMKEKPITKEDPGADLECKHLLDLLHKFYLSSFDSVPTDHTSIPVSGEVIPANQTVIPTSHPLKKDPAGNDIWGFNFCASQLLEAGIDFQMGSIDDHLLDITFNDGVIKMPPLIIEETTFSLFRNLIAFEQCSLSSKHHITSYAILMKSLIRSPRDINMLMKKGIITRNWIGYKECLAQFKSIKDQVVVKDFCFTELCNEANAYRKKWLHWKKQKVSWRARFERNLNFIHKRYFSTPWSIISFTAAVVLFLLTGIQTYYTIHPR